MKEEQLIEMFETAKVKVIDWGKVSSVNKGMTKGSAWNILAKGIKSGVKTHIMGKINMVREFGEFLPKEFLSEYETVKKQDNTTPHHQDPDFEIFDEEEKKLQEWEVPFEELFYNLDNIASDTDGKVRFSTEDIAEMVMIIKQKIKPFIKQTTDN
jgi:hypothetical protein